METDETTEGISVKVVHLGTPSQKNSTHDLGKRTLGAEGIVINASVPGFDSSAIRVKHKDAFGEDNGEWGIYFPGEYQRIPDLLPH